MERPKRSDTEDDVLEMQRKFLELKSKPNTFQPAAQVIKMQKEKKPSLFAQKRKKNDLAENKNSMEPPLKNISLGDVIERIDPTLSTKNEYVIDDIVDRHKNTIMALEKDEDIASSDVIEMMDPTLSKKNEYVIGEIVERPKTTIIALQKNDIISKNSFPEAKKIDFANMTIIKGKSLFAQAMEMEMEVDKQIESPNELKVQKNIFGDKSNIIADDNSAKSIHEENVNLLSNMTEQEIMEERANLMKCIDSKVLDFIKLQKNKIKPDVSACVEAVSKAMKNSTETVKINQPIEPENCSTEIQDIPAVSEVLTASESENWINFNIIEKEKLEWMKEIPDMIANKKPGESFEARFDWKGILLPYVDDQKDKDDRDLYMHGDEPFRPGYTLQELFRLARSNIIQQRCSAFNSINGILSIYNQGFYDSILEIPLTKIFFLLRYGMDENSIALLEIVSKGLSTLFYNETDETVLDFIFETPYGYLQPIIESIPSIEIESNADENIERNMKKMKLDSLPFQANLEEDEVQTKDSMTDFELAENDLIECFLRTNIIQRIYYILNTIRPENSTVTSCLKMLIRLARTNKEIAKKIVANENLIQHLIGNFLPGLQTIDLQVDCKFYNYPQFLVLKLFRIIMSQNISLCLKMLSFNILEIIKNYIYTTDDIKLNIIKVQIECFRILRVIIHIKQDLDVYKSLLPAFRYMLEWHYKHLSYETSGSFLMRQHASALLELISCGSAYEAKNLLIEVIEMCSSKWFYSAKQNGVKEFSQSTLLSSCLNCVNWMKTCNGGGFEEFIEKYLKPFISSSMFIELIRTLEFSSIVLKYDSNDRRNVDSQLPNMGTVLNNKSGPQLIISQNYPIYFLNSLFKLTETLVKHRIDSLMLCLLHVDVIEIFVRYLKMIAVKVNKKLATNFITKSEIKLIFKLLCFKGFHEFLKRPELLQAAFNLLSSMSTEHIQEIEFIFENIIFNKEYLNFEDKTLENWKQIYLETFVYPHRILVAPTDISLTLPCFPEPILPTDWPYILLKSLLNKYLQITSKEIVEKESEFPDSEIIRITFTFSSLLELNGLELTAPTEKLMYIMIAFMGVDAVFLDSKMKSLLNEHIEKFYKNNLETHFDFGGNFEGKSKFENLYLLFLDHFQAASYGDDLFSSLVLIPLAQKYDVKWRKMVWSEHASVLRFLNCSENQLLGGLKAYLEPDETDISLIKCYAQSLNSNLLRINSIPYKIATYHFERYKNKTNTILNNL